MKKLSNDEMKSAKGGYAPPTGNCTLSSCSSDSDCRDEMVCKKIDCTDDGIQSSYYMCQVGPNG